MTTCSGLKRRFNVKVVGFQFIKVLFYFDDCLDATTAFCKLMIFRRIYIAAIALLSIAYGDWSCTMDVQVLRLCERL